jgi:hypothetical protein
MYLLDTRQHVLVDSYSDDAAENDA